MSDDDQNNNIFNSICQLFYQHSYNFEMVAHTTTGDKTKLRNTPTKKSHTIKLNNVLKLPLEMNLHTRKLKKKYNAPTQYYKM